MNGSPWMPLILCVGGLVLPLAGWQRAGGLPAASACQAGDPGNALLQRERMVQWLEERNLWQRQLEFLEQELAVESDRGQRLSIANQLASRYAAQIARTSDPEAKSRWMVNGRRLLERVPDLESPRLEIGLWQAEYAARVADWESAWVAGNLRQPGRVAAWRELIDGLIRLEDRARRRGEEWRAKRRLEGRTAALSDDPLERDYEAAALQASYLSGWALYFSAILVPDEASSRLAAADAAFRRFFQVAADKPIEDLGKGWFQWPSPWTGLGLIGWAMTAELAGEPQAADHLFQLVADHDRRQMPLARDLFRFQSAAYAGNWDRATTVLGSVPRGTSVGKADLAGFWVSVFRVGQGLQGPRAAAGREFQREALVGLTREFEEGTLRSLVEAFQPQVAGDDFAAAWVRGYLAIVSAKNHQAEWPAARAELVKALQQADANTPRSDQARCRTLIGQIDFELGQFASAAEQFSVALPDLQGDPELAARTMWWEAQALIRSGPGDQRNLNRARQVLDRLVLEHPASRWARRVPFEKLKWESAHLPPTEALRRLGEISPEDPNYPEALVESLRIQHQVCLARMNESPANATVELDQLAAWERKLREDSRATAEAVVQGLLWRIDAEWRSDPVRPGPLNDSLSEASGRIRELDPDSSLWLSWRYVQFLVARDAGLWIAAPLAERVATEGRNDPREVPALIYLINQTEGAVGTRGTSQLVVRRAGWLERLLQIWGSDQDTLRRDPNARVAYAQLAECERINGQLASAIDRYQRLLELFPDHVAYLIGLAGSYTDGGDWERARPIWHRVNRGSAAGSDAWYEAKLGLIRCLVAVDPAAARELYDQTMRLSPEMPERWVTAFEGLPSALALPAEEIRGGGE